MKIETKVAPSVGKEGEAESLATAKYTLAEKVYNEVRAQTQRIYGEKGGGMAERFWMVYVEGTREPKVKHPTLELAKKEAERLVRLPDNIGKRAFVLVTYQYCSLCEQPVIWLTLPEAGGING